MDGIDHLLNLLVIVKSKGLDAAFAEDFSDGRQRSRNDNFEHYPKPLCTFRRSLEDWKLCLAALEGFMAHLKKKIRNLQKRCAPLALDDGIRRIPDEILAHIFEAGHQMSEYSGFSLRVSHVSGRFRQVSLRTHLLWTRLSSMHSDDQTKAFILRSGQLDLQVSLCDQPVDELKSYLNLIGPHSGRWSTLLLLMNPEDQGIIAEASLTYFPRLRSISHEFDIVSTGLQWNMPVLSHFNGYCTKFPRDTSFQFLSQLTFMELCFEDYYSIDMTSLAYVLYGSSNLRILSLDFRTCDGVSGDSIPATETPNPHSFHIESLKITLRESVAYDVVTSLYTILAYLTTSLVDISLLMHEDRHHFVTHRLFPPSSTLRLQISRPCSLTAVLGEILENCEILRSVEFEMTSFDDDTYIHPSWSHFPNPLRHLRFRNCALLEEKHVGTMVRHLRREADTALRSLEIISCKQISEEFLEDLRDEVGERLTWSL